jgi:hypothetical protein
MAKPNCIELPDCGPIPILGLTESFDVQIESVQGLEISLLDSRAKMG